MKYVIYTDLDGTLLDHETYSFKAALPAIHSAQKIGVPIVPVTSKTRAELNEIRSDLNFNTPFIVENGAAIFIEKDDALTKLRLMDYGFVETQTYWIKAFSLSREQWLSVIGGLLNDLPDCFTPFSNMSPNDIAKLTGLPVESAVLANEREYSDPLHWYGDDEQFSKLESLCVKQDIEVVKGGRFVHLIRGADKGKAVSFLHDLYKELNSTLSTKNLLLGITSPKAIVLGDGGNDVSMLNVADFPVCIRSESHDFPQVKNEHVIYSDEYGPQGWCAIVECLLKKDYK